MKNAFSICLVCVALSVPRVSSSSGTGDDLTLPEFDISVDRDPYEDAAVRALSDAEADLKKGFLRIRRYGHPSFVPDKKARILKERYKIEVVGEGCVSTEISIQAAAVYNAVMQRAIFARHGKTLAQLEWLIEKEPNQSPEPTSGLRPAAAHM